MLENFNIEKWRALRTRAKELTSQNELERIREISQESRGVVNLLLAERLPAEQKDFFLLEYFPMLVRDLLEHGEYKHTEAYTLCENLIVQIVELIARFLREDNVKLSESFKQIFDISRSFFRTNNQWEGDGVYVSRYFYSGGEGLLLKILSYRTLITIILACYLAFLKKNIHNSSKI